MTPEKKSAGELAVKPWVLYSHMRKETVPCSLCGSADLEKALDRDRYNMGIVTSLCRRCGFLFTNPRPTQSEMNEFYKDSYRLFYTGTERPEKEYEEDLHVRKRQWLFDLVKPELDRLDPVSPAVLDAGCGAGVILHLFRKHLPESRLFGVEPFPAFAAYARERSGADVHAGDLDSFIVEKAAALEGTLDLVILNHVLEHLFNPVEDLGAIGRLLKPNGLLLVQVPNILSPHWERALPIFHIAHVNHFTPSSLRYTFLKSGFEPLREIPLSLPVHNKAMTFLARKNDAARAQAPAETEVRQMRKELMVVARDARRTLYNGPFARVINCWLDRGPAYTASRFAHHAKQAAKRTVFAVDARKWRRYDSIGGELDARHNAPVLKRLLEGQSVLVVGAGPSAAELASLPPNVKVLTCNAALRLFEEKKLRKPDLFLCRKKVVFQDYPDLPDVLSRVGTHVLVMDERGFVQRDPRLASSHEILLRDHQKDNRYLKSLIRPVKMESIESGEVVWTSAGVRLLQYALHFGAKEVFLIGIDFAEDRYFWGGKFTHKHPIDFNFLRLVSKKYKNVFSLSPSSPATRWFPHKAWAASEIECARG